MDQFTGVYDPWGLQEEIRLLKVAQFDHTERLSQHSERLRKLEKRHDDSRIRSLWSTPSPFPAPLSTFSQQPANSEPGNFNGYDQQQNLVLAGLQLDEVDVPRRGASRANSVRFDDSATTNHWIHDSPGTSDYFGQRSTNSIGGYAMTERSSSHKSDNRSDGRQSLRSFGGDVSSYEGDDVFRLPTQSSDIVDSCLPRTSVPRVAPAPSIIRCCIDTASPYRPIFYAVVCTGSARSSIEMSLLVQLSLQTRITRTLEKEPRIKLPVYLPDAIGQQHPRTAGSKLPHILAEFVVLPERQQSDQGSEIRIFLGSDIIASHLGDVLFSQSKIFLHTDDGRKVFVPFTRPEAADTFSDIFTAHAEHYVPLDAKGQDNGNSIGKFSVGVNDSSMALGDSDRFHISVSSPRPIHGSQASVIRGVASMEPRDFTSKEHVPTPGQSCNTYRSADAGRPWTSPGDTRKQGFGAASSNEFSADPNPDFDIKVEVDGVTRGRSLTNPFEGPPITMAKPQGNKVWEGARKSSMSYSAPLKEGNGSGAGTGSYSRGSSRGMKVLRTSKSFSSSEKANHQSNSQGSGVESSTSTGPVKHASFTSVKSGNNRGHSRTMSGGDATHSSTNPKGSLVRTKSSNVVGGATAFHWMAPKATTGSE